MKTLNQNPAIIQTGWEPRKSPGGKVCYLIAAAYDKKEHCPILLLSKVFVPKLEKGSEENIVVVRLTDLKNSLSKYE